MLQVFPFFAAHWPEKASPNEALGWDVLLLPSEMGRGRIAEAETT